MSITVKSEIVVQETAARTVLTIGSHISDDELVIIWTPERSYAVSGLELMAATANAMNTG